MSPVVCWSPSSLCFHSARSTEEGGRRREGGREGGGRRKGGRREGGREGGGRRKGGRREGGRREEGGGRGEEGGGRREEGGEGGREGEEGGEGGREGEEGGGRREGGGGGKREGGSLVKKSVTRYPWEQYGEHSELSHTIHSLVFLNMASMTLNSSLGPTADGSLPWLLRLSFSDTVKEQHHQFC